MFLVIMQQRIITQDNNQLQQQNIGNAVGQQVLEQKQNVISSGNGKNATTQLVVRITPQSFCKLSEDIINLLLMWRIVKGNHQLANQKYLPYRYLF